MKRALKNVAVTALRPEPTVMRKIFFFGSLLVGIVAAEVMVSTMVMCWPVSGLLIFGTAHRRTLGVAAGIVAQQVVDRPHAEHLVEPIGGVGAQDVVQPIGECRHGYSTPISSASPRWPVR